MKFPARHHFLWHTLTRHVLLAVVAALAVCVLVTLAVWRFAEDDAHRRVESLARQVGSAVLGSLSERDFHRLDDPARQALRAHLQPFLRSGTVQRVKILQVEGARATVVYSDEPGTVGTSDHLDSTRPLSGDDVLIQPVPDNAAHRYETGLAGHRLEAFLGFRDAGGNDMRLELYLPVDVAGTTKYTALVLLPTVLLGLLLLTAATVPVSVALARRAERDRAEQRAAREYGLAAAELARRDLAHRLHDGIIPDLAGVGLLLQRIQLATTQTRDPAAEDPAAGQHPAAGQAQATAATSWAVPDHRPGQAHLLDRAQHLLTHEVQELRALLTELLPVDPVGRDLADALHQLAAQIAQTENPDPRPSVHIDVRGAEDLEHRTAVVLHRVAGELLRNAFRHSRAGTVHVRITGTALTVTDDGVGFDPAQAHRPGHVGLRLVRRLVEDNGGQVVMAGEPGGGTSVTVSLSDPGQAL